MAKFKFTPPKTVALSDAVIIIAEDDASNAVVRVCSRHPELIDVAQPHPINGPCWIPMTAAVADETDALRTQLWALLVLNHTSTVIDLRDLPPNRAVVIGHGGGEFVRVCCYSTESPTIEQQRTNACDEAVWVDTEIAADPMLDMICRAIAARHADDTLTIFLPPATPPGVQGADDRPASDTLPEERR